MMDMPIAEAKVSSTELIVEQREEEKHILSYKQHLKDVFAITYPIILSEIFQNVLPVVDIAFVGKLSKHELAAAALATVWFNLWNAFMMGFMTAIDTLLSQSYGAGKHDSFQICTGSSLVIVFGMTFPIAGLVALCGPIMHLMGQDPELADIAQEFSYRLIPGLFPYFLFKVLTKYLQTQNRLAPGVYIGIFANCMNVFFNWLLIFGLGWGLSGAPWATTLTRTMELLMICAYLLWSKKSLESKWPKFSKTHFRYANLKPFWKLAISGALSISADAWSFEVTTILASYLGVTALGGHIITFSLTTFLFLSFPFAVGIAASIRVGQLIGEQRAEDARRSSHASYILSGAVQLVLCTVLVVCKDIIGELFSSDPEVADVVTMLVPIGALYLVADGFLCSIGGVLRGLGRQKLVLFLNIFGFWVCAVPMGALLTFVGGIGVKGLWWGFNIGIDVSTLVGAWIVKYRIDWKQETEDAVDRLSHLTKTAPPKKSLSTEPTDKQVEATKESEEEETESC